MVNCSFYHYIATFIPINTFFLMSSSTDINLAIPAFFALVFVLVFALYIFLIFLMLYCFNIV